MEEGVDFRVTDLLDSVDAMVFSGDSFDLSPENRAYFRAMMARWERALKEKDEQNKENHVEVWLLVLSKYPDDLNGYARGFVENHLRRAGIARPHGDDHLDPDNYVTIAEKLASLSYTAKQLNYIGRLVEDIEDDDHREYMMSKGD